MSVSTGEGGAVVAGAGAWAAKACVIVGAAAALWLCASQLLVELSLERGPDAALRWAPGRADLIALAAEARADAATEDAQYAAAADMAGAAVRREPLDTIALLALALEADRRGDGERAAQLMTILGQRSYRDFQVQLWLAEAALSASDYREAFLRLDVVLRRSPDLFDVVFPIVAETLADPRATAPLARRLEANPTWREPFLIYLGEDAPADTVEPVLAALRATAAPPTNAESAPLLKTLVDRGDYGRARAIWTRLLPAGAAPDAALVYDGDFESPAGAPPFNWRMTSAADILAERGRAPDDRAALHVRASPARARRLAEQLVHLPPGAYRLAGEARAEGPGGSLRLTWRLSCVETPDGVIAEASIDGPDDEWRPFSTTVVVPDRGCAAQWLRLSNRPGDAFETRGAWIAGLTLKPMRAVPVAELASGRPRPG